MAAILKIYFSLLLLNRKANQPGTWYEASLIVLGFNDTSTLKGHFVSSPREREKEIEEIVEEMKERDREESGTGVKVKK